MSITGKIKTLFSDSAKTEALFPRTKTSAVSDDDGVGLNVLLENMETEVNAKQEKHKSISVSLSTSGWSSMAQTVAASNVTTNSTVVVTPAPDSHTAYGEAGVYCSAQANGTLTFTCTDTPKTNLTVNVLILN